ncbi:MAG TPA: IS1595 family transposase [Candidatus Acidoferrales bacterium]|nr:IS1595 family transposase [Candidatus Acidoferrales bacterium]
MEKIAGGLRLLMCVFGGAPIVVRAQGSHNQLLAGAAIKLLLGFVFLSVSSCPVKGQTESYSKSRLPDNPASKALILDKNEPDVPARESPKAAATINSNGRRHKFTMTTKLWVASSLAVYAAAALDMHATEEAVQRVNALHKRYPFFPEDYSFESNPLARPLEADETYLTPKKPRKGKPYVKKETTDVVLGMIERGGKLRLIPMADAKMKIIEPEIEKHISPDATLQTDESAVYAIIGQRRFPGRHRTINHRNAYAIGDNHTNSIENAFSLLKRGVYGTYHKVSIKHLGRYCDEFSYRFNRRRRAIADVRHNTEEPDSR